MSAHVFALVLLSALLHALWNAAVKASAKGKVPSSAIFVGAGVVSACVVPFFPMPALASWPFLVGSIIVHIGYSLMLGRAYRMGDFSHAYPIMRGLPPILTAGLVAIFGDEAMGVQELVGMLILCAGILSLVLESGPAPKSRATAGWAVLVAASISIYTIFDGFGGRASGSIVAYVAWLSMLEGICLAAIVAWREGPPALVLIARSWRISMVGGATSVGAYGLVVWAMTQAPIALVSALRETSVIFAAVLGVVLFKERLAPARVLAIALVVTGIMLVRLA